MSKPTAHDVDCEFVVDQESHTVRITVRSDVPIFRYKEGAQVIVDAVADAAMHYYSITEADWEKMADASSGDLDS